MIDDQLTFSEHIAKSARSCRFALFNIKKIRPFLSENASQLAGLLQCSLGRSIKPLQLIQSAAARFIFKIMHVTPLYLHYGWLDTIILASVQYLNVIPWYRYNR